MGAIIRIMSTNTADCWAHKYCELTKSLKPHPHPPENRNKKTPKQQQKQNKQKTKNKIQK